jgi:NitT/TauT family transport system substrate-binding protein
MNRCKRFSLVVAAFFAAAHLTTASAEVSEVRVAQQYGISYLGLMVMEREQLLQKHAREAQLGDIEVSWTKFTGGGVMNDALLSNSLDFASGGIAPFLTLWAKTKGTASEVGGVCARSSSEAYLDTRNPDIRSLKDFTPKDKIGLAAVKVSSVAVILQMAAEQQLGKGSEFKLDPLTVSMGPPDAMTALLSGLGGITANFTFPPYHDLQMKQPGIRNILRSNDVLGGLATLDMIYTTKKFRDANPKTYKAFLAAYQEAVDRINANRDWAAQVYLEMSKVKSSREEILDLLNDPSFTFTLVPMQNMKFADFMYRTGAIKIKPSSWKDLYFPEVHHLSGT